MIQGNSEEWVVGNDRWLCGDIQPIGVKVEVCMGHTATLGRYAPLASRLRLMCLTQRREDRGGRGGGGVDF